ncbi:hypothetical protein DPEC_G00122960 [Dallia pectoralis]|uniref:Uncharacterized protein n=1 Tax=Dallia pectoralis TaxID=75939 RepID=A0ACC2GQI7_DALPE|nr:hypothetical protein DPEC_G00122960 [Dallia pectoralis]
MSQEEESVRAFLARLQEAVPWRKWLPQASHKIQTPSTTPLMSKMAALENKRSGQALTTASSPAPKSVFLKNLQKAAQVDASNPFLKPHSLKPSSTETTRKTCSETESSYAKSHPKRPPSNTVLLENKVKPSPASGTSKPPWVKDSGSEIPSPPQLPAVPKPKISISALQSQREWRTSKVPPVLLASKLSPTSILKPLIPVVQQNALSRQGSKNEHGSVVKDGLNSSNSSDRPKPHYTLKPSFMSDLSGGNHEPSQLKEKDKPSAPKKKVLPNVFKLGNPPPKPNRPPHVNLQMFRTNDTGQSTVDISSSPTPHSRSLSDTPPLCIPTQSAVRNEADPGSNDNAVTINLSPPPPPGGHPNKRKESELSDDETYEDLDERWTEQDVKKEKETNEKENKKLPKEESSDEEMYEDLENKWIENEAMGSKEPKEEEKKIDKKDKKRIEQERKLQKAREKKEQEARRKYKLSEQIEVIQRAKAHSDCKGGKSDLPLKQGETIDIIRVNDNPDGCWLARNSEGNYGYVRIKSVDIDYSLLKLSSRISLPNLPIGEPEVYDDVAVPENTCSGLKDPQDEAGEIYDDVDGLNSTSYPHNRTEQDVKKEKETNEKENKKLPKEESSDEEMYEDLENKWIENEAMGSKEPKEEEKIDKKEKKRIEQERKLQKAREKKEQEARRKYKLSEQIEVIQRAKAHSDCKGGKSDLPLKQGETIDIIRINDNPDGCWLARNSEGNYGYVRIKSVDIDYSLLKRSSRISLPNLPTGEPAVYDDVAVPENTCSGLKYQQDKDGEIYDDVDGPNSTRFRDVPPAADEVYDDVETKSVSTNSLNSLPQVTEKGMHKEIDPKKRKKFEKEEKEFRKKFKFEGEIQVLYELTVAPTLANKKWGNKDLQLKPGEVIDVITKPKEDILIGRNSDGKFGYVSMVNVAKDSDDIYDDIGEDTVYDND